MIDIKRAGDSLVLDEFLIIIIVKYLCIITWSQPRNKVWQTNSLLAMFDGSRGAQDALSQDVSLQLVGVIKATQIKVD